MPRTTPSKQHLSHTATAILTSPLPTLGSSPGRHSNTSLHMVLAQPSQISGSVEILSHGQMAPFSGPVPLAVLSVYLMARHNSLETETRV